jgi:hypothetical protein
VWEFKNGNAGVPAQCVGLSGRGFFRSLMVSVARGLAPPPICVSPGEHRCSLWRGPLGVTRRQTVPMASATSNHPELEPLFICLLAWSSAAEKEGHQTPRLKDAGACVPHETTTPPFQETLSRFPSCTPAQLPNARLAEGRFSLRNSPGSPDGTSPSRRWWYWKSLQGSQPRKQSIRR